MPVARGIMQMGRINVFPTTTTLVSISPPDVGLCGEPVTFTVTVVNNRGGAFPFPTGTVLIKDSITNITLASGSLSHGLFDGYSKVIITSTISISNNQIYAQYVGVVNQFGTSQSSPTVSYSVSLIGTTTAIAINPGTDFCFHNNFNLNAYVVRTVGSAPVTTGSVQVNLYTDPISFTTIGTAALNVDGYATVVLPANTTVPGNNYYVQAQYFGSGCSGASASPTGTNGTLIHSVSVIQNTTNTSALVGFGSFCIHSSRFFIAVVTSAFLGGPSVGSVTWTAFKSPTTITLGTDSFLSGGVATLTIPGDTFPSSGNWTVTAAYTGDGYCFANSTSTGISVTPTTFGVDFVKGAGASSFCRATSQIFSYTVSSILGGTINGVFALKSSFGNTLQSVTTSGASTGFVVQFNLPANTVLSGAQNIFVQFTPVGGSCYSSDSSSNFPVTVTSSSTQSPSAVDLLISPGSGSSSTTFMFTITVHKGAGVGPLDGAGSLNGSASLFRFDNITSSFHLVNNNIHIFDNGTFGSGSFSTSGFPMSTTGAKAIWNGNGCYSTQESSFVPMDVFNPPH